MHNKLIVADNHITILGGRNLGDEYFGLNPKYNFHDLDVLGLGPAAHQMSKIFDHFWNSTWMVPGNAYAAEVPEGYLQREEQALVQSLEQSKVLRNFPLERHNWTDVLQSRNHPNFRQTSPNPDRRTANPVQLSEDPGFHARFSHDGFHAHRQFHFSRADGPVSLILEIPGISVVVLLTPGS
jgi:phosphatidylserine/phosphatidylglycerophosphate/cardiolipin synthase-like enzyme